MARQDFRGRYDSSYYSGAQTAIFIGPTLIDEVTSISYSVSQSRMPLYGYASTLFDAMAEGQVIVQGQFTINFTESGYLWLALNEYKRMEGGPYPLQPFTAQYDENGRYVGESTSRTSIEEAIDGEKATNYKDLASGIEKERILLEAQKSLGSYVSNKRLTGGMGGYENDAERYENLIWNGKSTDNLKNKDRDDSMMINARRVDSPMLNPFDIYITYGDYTGDDHLHHTTRKLEDVYITSTGQQVQIDGMPIQEQYSFMARNLL